MQSPSPHADQPEQPSPAAQPDPQPQPQPQLTPDQPPTTVASTTLSPDGRWRWDGSTWVPTTPTAASPLARFRDAGILARLAIACLVLCALAQVIALIADAGRLDVVNRVLNGANDDQTLNDAVASDSFVRLTSVLEILAGVVTAIVFLMWLHRVVVNNHAMGRRRLRFTPGWAVGWWFVPFLNLARPAQVMAESWRATDPASAEVRDMPAIGRLPVVLVAWWSCILLGDVLGTVSVNMRLSDSLQALHDATQVNLVWSVVLAVAAVLGAALVWQLTARQNALTSRLQADPAAA